MKYVISDIHGCYQEFVDLLKKINFSDEDILYIIGDVIDRGPYPIKTLKYIMSQQNMTLIMGNHEKMMMDALKKPREVQLGRDWTNQKCWYHNGGLITEKQFKNLKKEEQESILSYLEALPLGLEVKTENKDYILIHGGPTLGFNEDWDNQTLSEDVLWERFYHLSSKDVIYPGKIIIVGHTPTYLYGEEGIISIGDKRLIDCGCVFGDLLGCMCLDTEECFYIKKS